MGTNIVSYLTSFIGVHYMWGGDNALIGFDCSGLISEGLRSVGLCGKDRLTAQSIYDKVGKYTSTDVISEGNLLFFGKDLKNITHVAIAINNFQMLEAGGGGSTTTSEARAGEIDATVRIRPISWRKDLIGAKSL